MRLILILFLILGSYAFSQSGIRKVFHDGMFSEDKLEEIVESNGFKRTNLVNSYKGLAETMLADYVYFPLTKLNYFNDGKEKIEIGIKAEPKNPELRYLRLLVQLNAPSFLGYSSDIEKDISFFCDNIIKFGLPISWKVKFVDNLLAGEYLEESHKKKLESIKRKL